MKNKLSKIFRRKNKILIGAIHLPPLLGYPEYPGLKTALKNALADLQNLEKGGVDGVIFENNYDIPHKIFVEPPTAILMALIGQELRKATRLPLGVSFLWNDYKTALTLAKTLGLQFIRVPVFVDKVKTRYGIIEGSPKSVLDFRRSVHAENVALLTDIHVKHAELLSKSSLVASAKLAIKNQSDALIVTGRWTGEAPDLEKLKILKKSVGNFSILVGSGVDEKNIGVLSRYSNGAIVGTSLKKGGKQHGEINVKAYSQRIDLRRVKKIV